MRTRQDVMRVVAQATATVAISVGTVVILMVPVLTTL